MINHDKSKQEFVKVFQNLKDIVEQEKRAKESIEKVMANNYYSEMGRNEQINEIQKNLKLFAKGKADEIIKQLDEILKVEQSNAQIFDITDVEIQSAVSVLTATKGKLEPETIRQILNPFKGNKQAIVLLSSVLEHLGINKGYIQEIDIDIASSISQLKNDVRSLGANDTNISQVVKLKKATVKIANKLGIKFSEAEEDISINMLDFIVDNMRVAAGL